MRKLLLISLVCGLASVAACSSKSSELSAEDSRAVLIDRNWIDRMPEATTDRIHVYRFVPKMGGGVYQDRTLFKGTFELFMFEAQHGKIVFNLPETHQKVASNYTIQTVTGPSPFDLKLTISDDPRGPGVYYGIRAETDRDGSALEQKLAALRAESSK